jgi:SOS-response transcriptional repressor LexA
MKKEIQQDMEKEMQILLDLMPADLADDLTTEAMIANPRFAAWYTEEAARLETPEEREETEAIAELLARRMIARSRVREVSQRIVEVPRSARRALVTGTARRILPFSAAEHCAPLIALPVAAGVGYELWEEASDTWLELPPEIARGEYLALPVRGDSMEPVLHDGDTALVKVGNAAAPGSLIVARTPDDGYVVKYVEGYDATGLRLASLNPEYPSTVAASDALAVVGTVVARFAREET